MKAISVPIYPFKESGPVLVLGSAPCIHDDIKAALKAYPKAKKIGVSRIVSEISVDHIFKIEKPQVCSVVRVHDRCHPKARRPIVHTTKAYKHSKCANYYWTVADKPKQQEGICHTGTSGWAAANVAVAMGFDTVIMCGCPVEGVGYMDANPYRKAGGLLPENFNHWNSHNGVVSYYQQNIKRTMKDYEGIIFSMSGFTRDLMGEPKGL